MSELQEKYINTSEELEEAEEKIQKLKTKNLTKKIKIRDEKIKKLQKNKTELTKVENELSKSKLDLKEMETEVGKLKKEKQLLQQRLSYYKSQSEGYHETTDVLKTDIEREKLELSLKKSEIDLKEKELEALNAMLNDDVIKTFADGKYEDYVRQTIMELLSMNVSVNKVNEVILSVLKRFTGQVPEKLPSKGIRSKLLIEARHSADTHVGTAMLEGQDLSSVLGNTIHGDGTTKYHRHYQNFQITTIEGDTLSVGLTEIGGQDADTLLHSWRERINEAALALSATGKHNSIEETVNKLLASVKNTLSDHCATNGVFNELLRDMRADVLPKVISYWDSLAESDQKKLKDMGNFFCKVHPLVTFAEEANKALLKFESGSVRLIRTVCSAFHKRGHQAAGMEQYFVAYLNDLGIKLQLIAFEGNWFNIIFYNASAAFYHRTHIVNFIEHSAPSQNPLLSAVAEDYRNKVYLAGVRALEIIGKLITEPYFRIVGDTGSILDLNPHLHQLQISLQRFAQDASHLLDGEPVFDINLVPIDQSVVFENLLESDDQEFQVLTQQALELVCSAMLLCLERQCEDQLPGGKYWSPSPDLSAQAKSVPTSNITSERDFSVFDVLLKTQPSATTV